MAGRAHSRGSAADDENRIHVATLAPTARFRLVETARDKVAHFYARWHELELRQSTSTSLDDQFVEAAGPANSSFGRILCQKDTRVCFMPDCGARILRAEFCAVNCHEEMTTLRSYQRRLAGLFGQHSEHLVTVLEGAFKSFEQADNPVRFANTANTLRELFRELMEIIAADEQVEKSCWFKPDKSSKNGITRRHRCQYSVYGYVAPSNFPRNFSQSVEDLTKDILDGIGKLNAFTHITASSLARREIDAEDIFAEILENFGSLFDTIKRSRENLNDSLHVALQEAFDDLFTSEFFDSLDQLSSHTRPQGAADLEFKIEYIDENEIHFGGTGAVECDLQYGSDGDCRRGDGLEWSDNFPFTFAGSASAEDITQVSVDPAAVSINTDKYYEHDEAL